MVRKPTSAAAPLAVGQRVRLRSDVDRYPHFIAPAGSTGVVVDVGDATVFAVRMDEPLVGAEDWDNEIHWSNGDDPAPSLGVISEMAQVEDCDAVQQRRELTLAIQKASVPTGYPFRPFGADDGSEEALLEAFSVLHGIVNEYQDGGDQMVELCSCGRHCIGVTR